MNMIVGLGLSLGNVMGIGRDDDGIVNISF